MGSSKQSSSSRPLTAGERSSVYNTGIRDISRSLSSGSLPFTGYQSPGDPRLLTGGDYTRLEDQIYNTSAAPLQRFEGLERERLDQDLANRGVWSSGLAVRAQGDLTERLAPQYASIGGQAAQQRYGLQSQENQAANAWAQEEAMRQYQSQWRPLDYLQGLYNNTGGSISSSGGSGWTI